MGPLTTDGFPNASGGGARADLTADIAGEVAFVADGEVIRHRAEEQHAI